MHTNSDYKHTKEVKRKEFLPQIILGRSLEASNYKTYQPRGLAKFGETRGGGEGPEMKKEVRRKGRVKGAFIEMGKTSL